MERERKEFHVELGHQVFDLAISSYIEPLRLGVRIPTEASSRGVCAALEEDLTLP